MCDPRQCDGRDASGDGEDDDREREFAGPVAELVDAVDEQQAPDRPLA
jgi:hypothetical protein